MATSVELQRPAEIREKSSRQGLARKTGLFLLFLVCAIAVFVLGSNYYKIFPTNKNVTYEAATTAFFLIAALVCRRIPRLERYWQVAYAFFVAAGVILATSIIAPWRDVLFQSLRIPSPTTPPGWAYGKVFEALVTISLVLLLSRLAGMSFASIYVKRGNLKWGLVIGIGALVNFATSVMMFYYNRFPSPQELGAALFWGFIFSIANGFMEELWIRGQFLRKLEPLIGSGGAILLTGLWWSLFHAGAYYFAGAALVVFLFNLITFGLAFGYAMKKTDSWIAPGLMHAASDLFLFVATLSPV